MESDSVLQQMPTSYRPLQPQANQAIHHGQSHLGHHTLASQSGLDLTDLDENDAVFHPGLHRMQTAPHNQVFHTPNGFDHSHGPRHIHPQATGSPHTPQQHGAGTQFGIMTPGTAQHSSISRLQQENDVFGAPDAGDQQSTGHLPTRIVADPPNLQEWREKLFNVDETIALSEEE